MMKIHTFFNISAGILALDKNRDLNPQFVRIQSTVCEQKEWSRLIMDLDNNFLIKLASGDPCFIVDCKSIGKMRKDTRAIWQGLEFIKYCAMRSWDKAVISPPGPNFCNYFEDSYNKLSRVAKSKLRFYKRFAQYHDRAASLIGLSIRSEHVDNYEEIVKTYYDHINRIPNRFPQSDLMHLELYNEN